MAEGSRRKDALSGDAPLYRKEERVCGWWKQNGRYRRTSPCEYPQILRYGIDECTAML
ncbi:MAG: hypothetical protein IKF51_03820 [Solobacterium sp.]|nr:hypothetical protein [Solobacterium sp.]